MFCRVEYGGKQNANNKYVDVFHGRPLLNRNRRPHPHFHKYTQQCRKPSVHPKSIRTGLKMYRSLLALSLNIYLDSGKSRGDARGAAWRGVELYDGPGRCEPPSLSFSCRVGSALQLCVGSRLCAVHLI